MRGYHIKTMSLTLTFDEINLTSSLAKKEDLASDYDIYLNHIEVTNKFQCLKTTFSVCSHVQDPLQEPTK